MHILDILFEAPTFVYPCIYNILISTLILYVNNKWENWENQWKAKESLPVIDLEGKII